MIFDYSNQYYHKTLISMMPTRVSINFPAFQNSFVKHLIYPRNASSKVCIAQADYIYLFP